MAQRLAAGLRELPGAQLLFLVEANGVFVALPAPMQEGLRARGWRFYTFIGAGGARFMCAWIPRRKRSMRCSPTCGIVLVKLPRFCSHCGMPLVLATLAVWGRGSLRGELRSPR